MEEIADFSPTNRRTHSAGSSTGLLASPHYGEKWGRHWLDVARYADSNGLDENLAYVNAFRYRNYVIMRSTRISRTTSLSGNKSPATC